MNRQNTSDGPGPSLVFCLFISYYDTPPDHLRILLQTPDKTTLTDYIRDKIGDFKEVLFPSSWSPCLCSRNSSAIRPKESPSITMPTLASALPHLGLPF